MQKIMVGKMEIEWKNSEPQQHNDCTTHEAEVYVGEDELDEEFEEQIPPAVYFNPDCEEGNDVEVLEEDDDEDTTDMPGLCYPANRDNFEKKDVIWDSVDEEVELDMDLQVNMASVKPKEKSTGPLLDSGAAIHCGPSGQHMQGGKNPNKKNVTVASGTTLDVEKVGTVYFEDEETKSI
jgi:hypothetical protein